MKDLEDIELKAEMDEIMRSVESIMKKVETGAATATDDIALKATLAKGTDITGFNDLSAAQVNTEVDTAIADARLDELLAADSDIDGAAPPPWARCSTS